MNIKQRLDNLKTHWAAFLWTLKAYVEFARTVPLTEIKKDFPGFLVRLRDYPIHKRRMDRYVAQIAKDVKHGNAHGGLNMGGGFIRAFIDDDWSLKATSRPLVFTDKDRKLKDTEK